MITIDPNLSAGLFVGFIIGYLYWLSAYWFLEVRPKAERQREEETTRRQSYKEVNHPKPTSPPPPPPVYPVYGKDTGVCRVCNQFKPLMLSQGAICRDCY